MKVQRPNVAGTWLTPCFTSLRFDRRNPRRGKIVRVWQESPDTCLQGGPGLLPLALVAKVEKRGLEVENRAELFVSQA